MLKSKYLLFGFAISSIGIFIDFIKNLFLYLNGIDVDLPLFEKWIGLAQENIGSLLFYWLLPLSISIPYAWTMRDEMNNGYTAQILSRVKKTTYFLTKFLISFLSGAVIAVVTLLGSFWVHSFFLKAIYPRPNDMRAAIDPNMFLSKLYYANPYLHIFIWILVASLWCGVIAGLCYSLNFFIRKKTVIIISVQILFIIQDIVVSSDAFRYRYHDSLPWLKSWFDLVYITGSTYSPAIFINMAILLAIELIIIAVMGKRYENV